MKTNKTLQIAELFFKSLIILIIGGIISIIFITIHSSFSPKVYNNLTVNEKKGDLLYIFDTPEAPKTYREWKSTKNKKIYFIKLNNTSKLLILFKFLIPMSIILLILKELIIFVQSVKTYTLFHTNNSKVFKKIATYLTLILIFNLLFTTNKIVMVFPDHIFENHTGSIDFGPILLYFSGILISLVISQVFKEGERLKIESELTI